MRRLIESIEGEFRRYKGLGDGAMAQVRDEQLSAPMAGGNSIAIIVWHVSGNLTSRFTDFLTTDGEKPWRHRDEEFQAREVNRQELSGKWELGWAVLFEVLSALTDAQLSETVTIRRQPMAVHEALHRSLAHTAYHVGQIVHLAKTFSGAAWTSLSIPPGGSEAYNLSPSLERPSDHTAALRDDLLR